MRKVLSNHWNVAHFWANQIQSEGRANNMFFEGKSIYSYGKHFEIARIISPDTVFFNSRSYSISTSKHQGITRNSIPAYCKIFEVADFENHLENIKSYLWQIKDFQLKAVRARTRKKSYLSQCKNLVRTLKEYLEIFKVRLSGSVEKHIRNLLENADNILPEETEKALKEQERLERERLERRQRKEIKDWQSGKANRLNSHYAYLRIEDNLLCSSKGVKISLESARVLWEKMKKGRPVKGFILEGYTVIGIADGIFHIGCHRIPMKEIARIVKKLNW